MECYPSKLKLLGPLALTCAMVAMCYFVARMPGVFERVVGWVGVAFFGLGFIAFPIMFFRTGAQVIINDEGIEDRRMKVGVIRWEDIVSLHIASIESTKFLCIEVDDPQKYLDRLPRWTRPLTAATKAMNLPPLAIGFAGLSPGLKEVWAHVQERVAQRATEVHHSEVR